MTEWKDFLEGLPEDTALAIELTMALESLMRLDCEEQRPSDMSFADIKDKLKLGQEFMSNYVR